MSDVRPYRRDRGAGTLSVMTMSAVGALPVSAFAADIVARVAPDADLWEIAKLLVEADVGAARRRRRR